MIFFEFLAKSAVVGLFPEAVEKSDFFHFLFAETVIVITRAIASNGASKRVFYRYQRPARGRAIRFTLSVSIIVKAQARYRDLTISFFDIGSLSLHYCFAGWPSSNRFIPEFDR